MHCSCLIVDDETELAETTAEYFRMFEVSTHFVTSAEACYAFFEENSADLILLDINLGDGTGFEVCKRLREDMQLPILFISARQSDDDVLIALSIGGDDYIKKPYSLSVLLAKVKVILKRIEQAKHNRINMDSGENADGSRRSADNGSTAGSGSAGSNRESGEKDNVSADDMVDLRLDPGTLSVIVDGKKVTLKAKEFMLFKCLYDHHDTIVTKEVLFDEVWGDSFFSDSTLNVHIRKLREKIEEDPNEPKLIRTVWGTGYLLKLQKDDQ